MGEPGERAPGGAVGEVELDLDHAMPGAHGVDRHPDLHAEAVRERQHVAQRPLAQRPLPGYGGPGPQPAAPADRPAGEAEREPDAAAGARGEGADGDVRVPARDRVGERGQLDRRVAEIAVAENEDRFELGWGVVVRGSSAGAWAPSRASRAARVTAAPLPITRALRTTCAPAARAIAGVASVEPSSATQIGAPGNARASAPSVAAMRSASLCAATTTTVRGRVDRSAALSIVPVQWWRPAYGGSND